MKRIIVISDNHGDTETMKKILNHEKYDFAVHCGDHLISKKVMNELFDYWVMGNNDFFGKEKSDFNINNIKFHIEHGHLITYNLLNEEKVLKKINDLDYDVLLFGHTHVPQYSKNAEKHIFNPGSCSLPRNGFATYGIIEINRNELEFHIKNVSEIT
ncbi:MAG: metallophosphoesterase [Mycoplasma sp.]|nr:metallophosphoesterase [Mycoplasma sp.]